MRLEDATPAGARMPSFPIVGGTGFLAWQHGSMPILWRSGGHLCGLWRRRYPRRRTWAGAHVLLGPVQDGR